MKFADAVAKKEKENPAFKKARAEEAKLRSQISALRLKLRRLRENEGWDQTEMGERIGISQSAVSHFERGTGDVGLLTVLRYAQAFDHKIDLSVSASGDVNAKPIKIKQTPYVKAAAEIHRKSVSALTGVGTGRNQSTLIKQAGKSKKSGTLKPVGASSSKAR